MNGFFEFMSLAFPWISLEFLLVVIFVRGLKRKKDKHEDYGSAGMAIGMCFGVAIGSAVHIDIGLGLMTGMIIGFVIGLCIEKKNDQKNGGEAK